MNSVVSRRDRFGELGARWYPIAPPRFAEEVEEYGTVHRRDRPRSHSLNTMGRAPPPVTLRDHPRITDSHGLLL